MRKYHSNSSNSRLSNMEKDHLTKQGNNKMKTAILLLTLASASAMAETPQHRHWSVNAPAMCHPALLRFDSDVRKRPLAVVNEGTSSAFVTCSLQADLANPHGLKSVYAVLHNYNNAPRTAQCTVVYGADNGEQLYITRSVTMPAGARRRLELKPGDFGLDSLHNRVGISCYLAPFVGINEVGTEEKL